MNKTLEGIFHLILYLGFIIGAVAIFIWRFDGERQFMIVLLLVAFYLIWGYSYHSTKRDLCRKLILEYLAISLIGLLAAFVVFMS